ncbi:MAG: hypothetical protein U0521_22635 [Anaerolineae bacterium]
MPTLPKRPTFRRSRTRAKSPCPAGRKPTLPCATRWSARVFDDRILLNGSIVVVDS